MGQWVFVLAALVTGALVPVQLALNGQLGTALKSPYLGAFFVFVVGVLAMGAALLVMRQSLPSVQVLGAVPPLAWVGGLIATIYILAVVVLVPKLGVGSVAVLVIAGQVIAALALDHFGTFGTAQVQITWTKVFGGGLVLVGAALVRFA